VAFLDAIYRSETLGYKAYSDISKSYANFDAESLEKGLREFAEDANMEHQEFLSLFGMAKAISFDQISAMTHFEPMTIRKLKNLLARHRCILQKSPSVFEKSRGFIKFLKERLR
jgi:hypothetical protein